MPVGLNRTDFLDGVVVVYLIKKVLDSIYYQPSKYVIRIDINGIAISRDRELIM